MNGHFWDDSLNPLSHLEHAGLLRHGMPKHDPSFVDAERGGVHDIRRAIQHAVGLLLLSADDDVDVGTVYRGGRVADTELDAADLRVRIPYHPDCARARARSHCRSECSK